MSALCKRNDAANLLYKLVLDLKGEVKPFKVSEEEQTKYENDLEDYKKKKEEYE